MVVHVNRVFAALDRDHDLERIGGGNETEVYRTDDSRYTVKLKCGRGGAVRETIARARAMRAGADELVAWLGPRHTIPSQYVVGRDSAGRTQVLVIQPYLREARPLHLVDYTALSDAEREEITRQFHWLIRRSRAMYRATGRMPDLYGRTSASASERRHLNSPRQLPRRLWGFLVKRNLLRAHNLMLTDGPDRRLVLVDYDRVPRGPLYRWTYFTVRRLLFWRDLALVAWMRRGGRVPGGQCKTRGWPGQPARQRGI